MKNVFLVISVLLSSNICATIGTNVEKIYQIIFSNSMYTNQQKVDLINKTLQDKTLSDQDRNTLRNLKMIVDIFIRPQDKITVNSVLYRTPKETIMHWAAKLDQAYLMQKLIKYGAKIDPINQWKKTPLHYAAQWNSPATAKLLLDHGANIKAKDQYNKTPLDYAKEYRNKQVLKVLSLQIKKVDTKAQNICNSANIEQDIKQLQTIKNPYMTLEIAYSTIFNCKTYTNKNKIEVIDTILMRKDIPKNDRKTLEKIKMIIPLKKKIDANTVLSKKSKETIMHLAAQLDLLHLMKVLIKLGANISPLDANKKTPLHYAAEAHSPHTAQLLLSLGADPYKQDKYKKTAIGYAQTDPLTFKQFKKYIKPKQKSSQKLKQKSKSAPTLKNPLNSEKQKSKIRRQKSF